MKIRLMLALLFSAFAASAAVSLPGLFGDHALLQRDKATAIWGQETPGREVTVSLGGVSAKAKADSDGWWLVKLDTSALPDGPFDLVVEGTEGKVVSHDVVLGELWLAGGQSNMAFKMKSASYGWIFGAEQYRAEAASRPIRFFRARSSGGNEPVKGMARGTWYVPDADSITNASAVAYCFVDAVQKKIGGRIGFIDIAVGGSRVWQWLSRETVLSNPALKQEMEEQDAAAKLNTKEGKWRARKRIYRLYNGLFHPLKDLSCRGIVWYQGCNDYELGDAGAEVYAKWFKMQVESWRKDMQKPDLPFYYCQLAGYSRPISSPGAPDGTSAVREGQRRAWRRIPNAEMAVILQTGEAECHGRDKKTVGERLARIALARTYGQKGIVYRAPDFRTLKVEGSDAIVTFETFGSPLVAHPIQTEYSIDAKHDGSKNPKRKIERRSTAASQLEGFEIRDADGTWHWADAEITGPSTVRVHAAGVTKPMVVRYNWGIIAFGNLYNEAGLPASTFYAVKPLVVGISDTFPMVPKGDYPKVQVNVSYAEALSRAGHLPVVIPRCGSDEQFDAIVSRLDALVMTGGEDFDPALYGAKRSPKLGVVNAPRDDFDLRLLAAARRRRLPVLGICRGCQLLNIAFGGTLWQDLPSEFPGKDIQHRKVHHPVQIVPGSRLALAIGTTNTVVNSYHHQAAQKVAPGFRVTATAPDGVIEAIESEQYPAVGLQFHPEKLFYSEDRPMFTRLFENLFYLLGK